MPTTVEREVKLRFTSADEARRAIVSTGAEPLRPRRLQRDHLLDTAEGTFKRAGSVLRVRVDPAGAALTFKGPVESGIVKIRDEVETPIADSAALLHILERAGFSVWFRYEK